MSYQVGDSVTCDMGRVWFVDQVFTDGSLRMCDWDSRDTGIGTGKGLRPYTCPPQPSDYFIGLLTQDGPCQHTRRGYIGPMHGWACYHCGVKLD